MFHCYGLPSWAYPAGLLYVAFRCVAIWRWLISGLKMFPVDLAICFAYSPCWAIYLRLQYILHDLCQHVVPLGRHLINAKVFSRFHNTHQNFFYRSKDSVLMTYCTFWTHLKCIKCICQLDPETKTTFINIHKPCHKAQNQYSCINACIAVRVILHMQ